MSVNETEMALDRFVEAIFQRLIEHHSRRVAELDLTISQAQALRVLRREPLSTGKLAVELRISAPAVTQLTDRLNRKRLIERRPADGDRRSVLVVLTAEGKRLVDHVRERRNQVLAEALSGLAEKDRAEVIEVLRKMAAVLEGDTAPPSIRPAAKAQTAVQPVEASNIVTETKHRPVVRKIRMEWD